MIKKIIKNVLHIPLYYFSYLIPKNKNLWIIGGWSGMKFTDNSKYFFEYINNNYSNIKIIWLTKSKDTFNQLKQKGYKVEYAYSLKGYLLSMRAKVAIVSHSKLGDLNGYVLNKKTLFVQLWHGNPIKKIGYDTISSKKYKLNEKLKYIFPWLDSNYDVFCVTSDYVKKFFHSAFYINYDNIYVTGYPRNQVLLENKNNVFKEKRIIYMPTYRDKTELELKLIDSLDFNKLNKFLEKNNIYLDIKLHPQSILYKRLQNLTFSNIKLVDLEDIYEFLYKYHLLITDYSSIYFDFLLLDRPVVLLPVDLEEYKNLRGIYQDYFKEFKEHIALNTDELIMHLNNIFNKKIDKYKTDRMILKKKYNDLTINQIFSENVKQIIDKVINK